MSWYTNDTPLQVHTNIQQYWDLSGDLPTPRANLKCGCCGGSRWQPRNFGPFIHRDTGHRIMHRMNVFMKCTLCSATVGFGLALDPETYERMLPYTGDWRKYFRPDNVIPR